MDAPAGAITDPAWRTKPSWYLVATEDRMIPPPAQHAMAERVGATLSEVAASHSVYLSQPETVATLIAQAAAGAAERQAPRQTPSRPLTVATAPRPGRGQGSATTSLVPSTTPLASQLRLRIGNDDRLGAAGRRQRRSHSGTTKTSVKWIDRLDK